MWRTIDSTTRTSLVPLGTVLGTGTKKGLPRCSETLCFSEAPAGFEPAMADLQSAALATWPRRLTLLKLEKLDPLVNR